MTGGLMQLVAYGAQDIYLTGNAQITYFKVVYRRHTNFAMESIEQTFNGSADFNKKVTCLISRNGDLINRVYLCATLPEVTVSSGSFRWVDDIGHHLVKNADVEIGGQRIDRQSGDWMQIWAELTVSAGHKTGFKNMIGHQALVDSTGTVNELSLQCFNSEDKPETLLYVPLQFWFCRNVGLSLPLIALQYHEVKITLDFRRSTECSITSSGATISDLNLGNTTLWVDYIYLDTDERRRFAQVSHEYLIEQVQFTGDESVSSTSDTTDEKVKLNFNHPVKELVWVVQHNDLADANQWSNYTDIKADDDEECTNPSESSNPTVSAKLQLNGHDRFATRAGDYFNWVQPYQHHTNVPTSPGVNVYSFALKPEEHQPSGSCNFSRIDNATLQLGLGYTSDTSTGTNSNLTSVKAKVRVYAVNYNVLRIMSGMGGLAYSN
jgi:hypothetical protein